MKLGKKRHRIKHVQVQEKIIHKERLQYFIEGWAEVHHSPPLWQKSISSVSRSELYTQDSVDFLLQWLRRSDLNPPPPPPTHPTPAASLVPDRQRRSQVAGCNVAVTPSPARPHRSWGVADASPVLFHHNRHRYEKEQQLYEIKLTEKQNKTKNVLWLFSVGFFFPLSWSDRMNWCSDAFSSVNFICRWHELSRARIGSSETLDL